MFCSPTLSARTHVYTHHVTRTTATHGVRTGHIPEFALPMVRRNVAIMQPKLPGAGGNRGLRHLRVLDLLLAWLLKYERGNTK